MKAYGHSESVCNMRYLKDCIDALLNVLRKVAQASAVHKSCVDVFGFALVEKVWSAGEAVLSEVRKFPRKFVCAVAEDQGVTPRLISRS